MKNDIAVDSFQEVSDVFPFPASIPFFHQSKITWPHSVCTIRGARAFLFTNGVLCHFSGL